MECKCGGSTTDHKVVENKIMVQTFAACTSCGRVGKRLYFDEDGLIKKEVKK